VAFDDDTDGMAVELRSQDDLVRLRQLVREQAVA